MWSPLGEPTRAQGQAVPILAPKVARAVDSMVTRAPVWERDRVRHGSGSSVGAPAASRDPPGIRLPARPWQRSRALRHGTRHRPEAFCSEPSRWLGHPRWRRDLR
jgi:hypothetical protein